MKIRNVTVKTGRTMPNPHEGYANLRTDIIISADLDDTEDPDAAIRELQIKANAAVDTDMQRTMDALELKQRARRRDEAEDFPDEP